MYGVSARFMPKWCKNRVTGRFLLESSPRP